MISVTRPLSAVVLGATGAVGANVVRELLRSQAFGRITTLTRRPLDMPEAGERVAQHITDVFDSSGYEPLLAGHTTAFCTLGLGEPSKVKPEEFYRVDFQCVADFAAACDRQGVTHFSLLTAVGSNARSRFNYTRVKGEIEERVQAFGFARVSLFRPSLLVTPKNRYGFTQALLLKVFPMLDWLLLGPLSKFRSIRVEDLGCAMVRNAERPGKGLEIFEWSGFQKLLRN
jgi:uncharacterized protein YbjT (DUF2867 family)